MSKPKGGKRQGAGRPATLIDERRMMVLIGQGVSRVEIAGRFGVGKHVITDRVQKLKKGNL
jgi:transposase